MLFTLLNTNLPFIYIIGLLIVYLLVLMVSLGSHEYAHALAAYHNGDYTAKNLGRMTINPFAHFDTYGFVCLLLLGFGWAKPVPVNPYYLNRGKKSLFQVAVAGVLANLILAIFFALLISVLYTFCFGFIISGSYWAILIENFAILGLNINLSLAIFNLLPFYPLDGSKILELCLKPENRFIQFLKRYSMLILLALLLFGIVSYILEIAVSFLGTGMITLWSMLFGLFM